MDIEKWLETFAPAENYTGRETNVKKAKLSPTTVEIHRAAAWWAAEGSTRMNGTGVTVTIPQKEVEVLMWLMERFGGSLRYQGRKTGKKSPIWVWAVSGPRARGFLLTIYSCLDESPRRQEQIFEVMQKSNEIVPRGTKPKLYCERGHRKKEAGGRCMRCEKIWRDKHRAKPEVREKRRQQERERYHSRPEVKAKKLAREKERYIKKKEALNER